MSRVLSRERETTTTDILHQHVHGGSRNLLLSDREACPCTGNIGVEVEALFSISSYSVHNDVYLEGYVA